jgi:SDR family mycofactocin-dependent oxidoreductase
MGRVQGKVALITGAARGQGRSHAITLAKEGADIIAVDVCNDNVAYNYPNGTAADLAETVKQVEALDRRILAVQADVRSRDALEKVVADGMTEFGKLDVVVANAGICPLGGDKPYQAWIDVVDVNLLGVFNAIHSALPHMQAGGSVMATGSMVAFLPGSTDDPNAGPGGAGYSFAKKMIAQFMHDLSLQLAPFQIRANCVHPTSCNTMLMNHQTMYDTFCPDIENPTREQALERYPSLIPMGVPLIEPIDISNAVLFLASDESRYVTGMQFRVDGGGYVKFNPYKG